MYNSSQEDPVAEQASSIGFRRTGDAGSNPDGIANQNQGANSPASCTRNENPASVDVSADGVGSYINIRSGTSYGETIPTRSTKWPTGS